MFLIQIVLIQQISFFGGGSHWYSCCVLLAMSAIGFKGRIPLPACFIACVLWISLGSQAVLVHILVHLFTTFIFWFHSKDLLCHDDLGGGFWLVPSDTSGRPLVTDMTDPSNKFCHRGNYGPEAPVLLTADINGKMHLFSSQPALNDLTELDDKIDLKAGVLTVTLWRKVW